MKEPNSTPQAETECLETRDPAALPAADTVTPTSGVTGSGDTAAAEANLDPAEVALREQLNDRYLRLAAEFENYKKRTTREWQAREQSANSELLLELLEVADNFERALHAEHEESLYAHGVALIYDQLQGLLERRGVTPLVTEGVKFDPVVHEALMHLTSEEVPAGHVTSELRRGYTLHGRALRPAQVAVSSGPGARVSPDPAPETDQHEKGIESGAENE